MKKIISILIGLIFLIPIVALSLPNVQATASFSDDFESGNIWTPTGPYNGNAEITATESHSSTHSYHDSMYYSPGYPFVYHTMSGGIKYAPFQVSEWIKWSSLPDGSGGSHSQNIISVYNFNTFTTFTTFYMDASGWKISDISHPDYSNSYFSAVLPSINVWHQIFIDFNTDTTGTVYIDGISIGTFNCDSLSAGIDTLEFGHGYGSSVVPNYDCYRDDIAFGTGLPIYSTLPHITSVPILTATPGNSYSYNTVANQIGNWTVSKPTWMSISGSVHMSNHFTLIGTAPSGNYSVKLTLHNANGTAWQNFSVNSVAPNPHFVVVDVFTLRPGDQNYSVLVSWTGTSFGQMLTPAGTTIDQLYFEFQPTYPYSVIMQTSVRIFDNTTQIYLRNFDPVVTNGNPASIYHFYTGQGTLNSPAIPVGITTQAGHFYYIQIATKIANDTQPLPTQGFSGTITTSIPASVQQNWISGILWILILFTGPWIMNWFFPRYGFLVGMVLMAVLLSISTPSFIYVGLIIVMVIAIEGYALSKSGV